MDTELLAFSGILALLWFLVYWILGGVFFALMTALRLGRIKKVRFSCLFSFLALFCAILAAYAGMILSERSVNTCLAESVGKAEEITAIFGCGFAGIFGAFLIGALFLILGGFFIMSISKSKSRSWIQIDSTEEDEERRELLGEEKNEKSEFF